jgi:hypothetical protein
LHQQGSLATGKTHKTNTKMANNSTRPAAAACNANSQANLPSIRPVSNQELELYKDHIVKLYTSNTMERVQKIMKEKEGIYAT